MNLKKILRSQTVVMGLKGTNKKEIIEEMVQIIVSTSESLDREALLKAVFDREAQMSTGMQNGIAIPHGKTDAVSELYAAVGVSRKPVPFDCIDKESAQIFIMTISPASHTGPHLQFISEISRLLGQQTLRERILQARDEDQLLQILLEG